MGLVFKMVAYPQLSEIHRQYFKKDSEFEVLLVMIEGVSSSYVITP